MISACQPPPMRAAATHGRSGPQRALAFAYDALPGRVVFGRGVARTRLAAEMEHVGAARVMVVSAPGEAALARELTAPIRERVALHFDRARQHVPEDVADHACAAAREHGVDVLLSIGGGSTTGTAKIVALREGLPVIAVPTTYAGSEITPIWGLTTAAGKQTGHSLAVLPRVVLYDPDLVDSLPAPLAVSSALNAMAHCAESLWRASAPVIGRMALDGARALAAGLRSASTDPKHSSELLLYGAYLAGASFAVAGSGLHHKICHILGGSFDLPHAQTHAVVLPYVVTFNTPAMPEQMARLGEALTDADSGGAPQGAAADATTALRALYATSHVPPSLAELGLSRDELARAIDLVATKLLPIDNPRPVGKDDVAALLTAAYEGIPS